MATNGFYKDDLFPDLNNMILPVISNIIITKPLSKEDMLGVSQRMQRQHVQRAQQGQLPDAPPIDPSDNPVW